MPPYVTTCPICGGQLEAVTDQSPQTAPWLCPEDARGWWPTELTPEARSRWDNTTRSVDAGAVQDLLLGILIDRGRADEAGTSRIPEHGGRR